MNVTNKLLKNITIITLISASSANFAVADEDDNYLKLAEKLVLLRGEVSDLSSELQLIRDQHLLDMRGLITQKNSVKANLKQEEMSLLQLKQNLLENKKLIHSIGADKETIKNTLLTEIEKLKMYVATGLPFKADERMKSLLSYENNLKAGVLSSHKAANTLWSMIEDELKLARDNGVYRQSVRLGDKENLARVAKLGMVMMYFKIGDDQYGMYRKKGSDWVAELSHQKRDIEQIKNLFVSLEKQIHVGYFELPNTL